MKNKKKYTCLIVEDEPLSQEITVDYVSNCPELDLVAVCSNAMEANSVLHEKEIALLFLDIHMPQINGIDWWKSLHHPPEVIFITAYSEYAVEGFTLNAIDYLLKPFSFDRFLQAVNKFIVSKKSKDNVIDHDAILVKSDKKIYPVKYSDITFIEANGDYLKLFRGNDCLLLHETLKKFQEKLPQGQFLQVHRSFIVNTQKIDFIESNQIAIGQYRISISEGCRKRVKQHLDKTKGWL